MEMQKYNIFYTLFRGDISTNDARRELDRLKKKENQVERKTKQVPFNKLPAVSHVRG